VRGPAERMVTLSGKKPRGTRRRVSERDHEETWCVRTSYDWVASNSCIGFEVRIVFRRRNEEVTHQGHPQLQTQV